MTYNQCFLKWTFDLCHQYVIPNGNDFYGQGFFAAKREQLLINNLSVEMLIY